MEQKIVTGGTSSTNTPMLKFLMNNALLEPANEARHIEHCPDAEVLNKRAAAIAAITNTTTLVRKQVRINVPRLPAEAASL